jgi:hypothetical protein
VGLGRALGFTRSDRHRFWQGISEHWGARFGHVQLFTQFPDLLLDHLLECVLLVTVIDSKKN